MESAGRSDEREVLTVEETAKRLGISRNSAYKHVRAGAIPALRLGRRLVVPRAALASLLSEGRIR
jgi:excisionase family DNA binding protein